MFDGYGCQGAVLSVDPPGGRILLALVRGVIDHVEWAPGGTEVFLSKYRADAPDTVAERRPC